MDHVASQARSTVDAASLGSDKVFHYSIPTFDETRDGAYENPVEIGSNKTLLRGDELLISKLNPRKQRILRAKRHEVPTVCSGEFVVLRPHGVNPRYLEYLLLGEDTRQYLSARVQSVTRSQQRVRPEDITKMWFELPPVSAQRRVAGYLDRETARIETLIAAKRRMVELLEEKRSELATHLLLGPPLAGGAAGHGQVTLRPGWSLVPFRRLFREIDVRSATGSETLLSVSQTRGVIPQSELGDRRQYADTLVGYKTCMSRDLVVNRMWVYYGALGAASIPGIVSPDYAVFRPTGEMSSEFAAYVLRTPAYVGEMTRLVRGIGAAFQGTVRKPRLHPSELVGLR